MARDRAVQLEARLAVPRREPGFSAAGWAELALALLLLLPAGIFVWLHASGPSDGARLEPGRLVWKTNGVVVTPLVEHPGGLHPGDLVVAVEGRPTETWAGRLFALDGLGPAWRFGQMVSYGVVRDGRRIDLSVTLREWPFGAILAKNWSTILFAVVWQLVATFVFLRRPRDQPAGIMLLWASSLLSSTTWSLGLEVRDLVDWVSFWLFSLTTKVAYLLFWVLGLHFALVFPRPQLDLRWRPWLVPALYTTPCVLYLAYLAFAWRGASSTLDWLGRWAAGESVLVFLCLALMLGAMVRSYRVNRDTVTRRQIRWVVLAGLLSGGGGLVLWALPEVVLGQPIVDASALGLLVLPFPLVLAAAILRYRLFDVDVVINRTLVYGALTTGIVGLYVGVVGYLGALLSERTHLTISLLATGLVAVLFQPARARLQRAVNRLMYGERDDPYAVVSRLGQRLETILAPEAVLPAIVETVAQALKLPYAAIALKQDEELETVATLGTSAGQVLDLPLVYQGETVGQLSLAPRGPREPFSPADWRLLNDLARQAGVAVHAVRLTADLQRSRERLVTAREEERRRLRRDLHDGLGPALASLTLKLDAARNLLARDTSAADALLAELKAQTQAAIADIRRLVYELRPPALDDLGLVSAVREYATRYAEAGAQQGEWTTPRDGRYVTVEAQEVLPPLPAAVEVAAYRIVLEALTNVVRHAGACACVVRLSVAERNVLQVEIADDGRGMPSDRQAGVGLTSMRERASEVGGTCVIEGEPGAGTRVLARLPLSSVRRLDE